MGIGAQDAANMMNKSQMVGNTQALRADQQIKETDKSRESEKARDADPESTAENTTSVGSSSGANRTGDVRKNGQEARGLHRLGRGQVEWQDQEKNKGSEWLPPNLRPQAKSAGTSNAYNIPYWLMSSRGEKPGEDNPASSHRRLLNGLRNMVHTEIQQYIKSNEPPYAKKTLREIYNVLGEDSDSGQQSAPASQNAAGEVAGLTNTNWTRAQATVAMLENEQPEPGEAFEMVA
jgi:hypothetical protein